MSSSPDLKIQTTAVVRLPSETATIRNIQLLMRSIRGF